MKKYNIINTRHLPPGFSKHRNTALEAKAYHELNPYPYFGFPQWKTEDLGPYPRCLPIPFAITRRSAIWLFGKPIKINFLGSNDIDKELDCIWKYNKMSSRLVPLAMQAGFEGEMAVKFVVDQKTKRVRFIFLSTVSEVKFFYDPHDCEKVIMVRIQYPYLDPGDGKWYWFREEWSDEEYVTYHRQEIKNYGSDPKNPYAYLGDPIFPAIDTVTEWEIKSRGANPNKIIPVVKFKNLDSGYEYGIGDCWNLFRVIDRINLSYHLMDKSNQLDVDPEKVFIDVEPKEGDSLDSARAPGAVTDVKSLDDENGTRKGDVKILENTGKMLERITAYADEMKQILFDATGAVFPRQEHITNKGSLTMSVLVQMYAPLLEVTDEKRKSYGEGGICVLIKTLCIALKNLGFDKFKSLPDVDIADEALDCNITWFEQFKQTEDEKFAVFDRIDREVMGGFIPVEIAIDKIAKLEELDLTEEQKNKQKEVLNGRIETEQQNLREANEENADGGESDRRRGNDPGGSADANRSSRQQKGGQRVKDAS